MKIEIDQSVDDSESNADFPIASTYEISQSEDVVIKEEDKEESEQKDEPTGSKKKKRSTYPPPDPTK